MKFHIYKDLVTQISYFKSRRGPVSLGGEIENLGKGLEWRDRDETWWKK